MTGLSEDQVARVVREALRAYHDNAESGKAQHTWIDVWEEIAHTAQKNDQELTLKPETGAERLRQFVYGMSKEGGTLRYPMPQPAMMDAIITFLTAKGSLNA